VSTLTGLALVRDHLSTVHALRADGRTACGLRASPQLSWFLDGPLCGRCRRVVAAARSYCRKTDAKPRTRKGAA
jgi:hypothetical protein